MNPSPTSPTGSSRAWTGVLLGGLVAGIFDILYAIIASSLNGRPPFRVLQSVALGVLGVEVWDGGVPVGLLGLFCHFVIAFGASVTYYLASRRIALLRERPVIAGAIFGILVFLTMNWVVIPLAACPFSIPFTLPVLAKGFLSHAVLIGIPIALLQKRYSGAR